MHRQKYPSLLTGCLPLWPTGRGKAPVKHNRHFRRERVQMALIVGLLGLVLIVGLQRARTPVTPHSRVLVPFSLAPGAVSAPIAIVADRPVFVVGNSTTPGDRGTGHMSVERATGQFLEWSGLNSPTAGGPPTITGNFTGTSGTEMLQIDFNTGGPGVFIEVGPNGDNMVVHNRNSFSVTGSVLIYN